MVKSSSDKVIRRLPYWIDRLFLLTEWALLLTTIGLWSATRTYQPWMNIGSGLLVTSWLVRWVRLGQLTRSTPLDLLLLLFLASVFAGLWAAPDQSAALVRLYLFLGAIGLYYALVNSTEREATLFTLGLVVVAAALGLYFASQYNWVEQGAKLAVIGSLGWRLNQIIPDLNLYKPHPNVISSILAVVAPVALVGLGKTVSSHNDAGVQRWVNLAIYGLGGGALLFGLLMTESRAAWLAFAGAIALAVWWLLAARIGRLIGEKQHTIFWLGILLGIVSVGLVIVANPRLLTLAFGALPGPNSAISRIEVYTQVWRLAHDTPYSGGGLAAFPALYSTYVLVIPFLSLTHAHNAYLNIFVEQGWLGLISYIGLVVIGFWVAVSLLRRENNLRMTAVAGALGLAVIMFQSLGDATLVASRAIVVLLVPAGLVFSANNSLQNKRVVEGKDPDQISNSRSIVWAGLALVLLVGAAFAFYHPLLAAWYANQGVVQHHRIELAGWPPNVWDDGSNAGQYQSIEPDFQKALALVPDQRAAHHHLGLAAALRRDFQLAADHLEQAHNTDPEHRGITKALGYNAVWLGEFERAAPLLATIPEASSELEVYSWWWGTQGRGDLASLAQVMLNAS